MINFKPRHFCGKALIPLLFSCFFVSSTYSQSCGQLGLTEVSKVVGTCAEEFLTPLHDQLGRDFVYVATEDGGLTIWDVSSPASPSMAAQVQTNNWDNLKVMSVTQNGNYVYLALGNHFPPQELPGMAIVDVSNPSLPVMKDYWISPGDSSGGGVVVVEGDYAYFGAMSRGLYILDIQDKDSIKVISHFMPDLSFPGNLIIDTPKYNVRGLFLEGDVLYTAFDRGGIRIINVSDKQNPKETGHYSNPALLFKPRAYNHLIVKDTILYSASDYCGLEILSVADTSDIKEISWWNPWNCQTGNWFGNRIHFNELKYSSKCDLLVVSSGKSEAYILDVSDPAFPDSCGHFGVVNDDTASWGVDIWEDHIYLTFICSWPPPFSPFYANYSGMKVIEWDDNPCLAAATTPEIEFRASFFPVPVSDRLSIELNGASGAEVLIWSMEGRVLHKGMIRGSRDQLDVSMVASGPFICELRTSGGKSIRKLLIKSS